MYLEAERTSINETLSRKAVVEEAYRSGDMEFEEYREYLSAYNYAYSRDELLKTSEEHRDYLMELEEKPGVKGWFLYDIGWRKLFSGDADLFLYASLLLLLTGSFAAEYASRSSSGSFAQILQGGYFPGQAHIRRNHFGDAGCSLRRSGLPDRVCRP